MLRSLDTLIGFVTVLLVLSLAVTMLTQMATNFLRLRSRHLREGVLDLFRQLGWGFVGDGAEILANRVVRVKDAITREDLIETLLLKAGSSRMTSPMSRSASAAASATRVDGPFSNSNRASIDFGCFSTANTLAIAIFTSGSVSNANCASKGFNDAASLMFRKASS